MTTGGVNDDDDYNADKSTVMIESNDALNST